MVAENVSLERLRAWIDNPNTEVLTADEKRIWERIDFAYDQLKTETPREVVNRIVKKFNISRTQATKDIQLCNQLLAPTNRTDIEWMRNFIISDAMLQIKVAQEMLDMKGWAAARDTIMKVYLNELNSQAPIDPELLGRNTYYALININGNVEKLELDKLTGLPREKKEELAQIILEDITPQVAETIMNS